jgi:hypothetical protein
VIHPRSDMRRCGRRYLKVVDYPNYRVQMTQDQLNKLQKKLVEDSERAHEAGIRQTGLSGQVCEFLLRKELEKRFPTVNFDTGVVILKPCQLAGLNSPLSRRGVASPQIDIIAYKGKPVIRFGEIISIMEPSVLFAIEVKKWITEKNMKVVNKQVERLKTDLARMVLLVSFRHHGNFSQIKKLSVADQTFLFSRATPKNQYPWTDKTIWLHEGELEGLFDGIDKILMGCN